MSLGAIAESERERIRERVVAGLQRAKAARAQGTRPDGWNAVHMSLGPRELRRSVDAAERSIENQRAANAGLLPEVIVAC
jgi:DNA invertase Pin-like site-specific DNA recombinase